MNLPDLYARVVAKRPELAVPILEYDPDFAVTREDRGWSIGTSRNFRTAIASDVAAAMILARWVEALPNNRGIHHGDRGWSISRCDDEGWWNCESTAQTPLEALAAFYLGEQP